jgi:hypothetical protein
MFTGILCWFQTSILNILYSSPHQRIYSQVFTPRTSHPTLATSLTRSRRIDVKFRNSLSVIGHFNDLCIVLAAFIQYPFPCSNLQFQVKHMTPLRHGVPPATTCMPFFIACMPVDVINMNTGHD